MLLLLPVTQDVALNFVRCVSVSLGQVPINFVFNWWKSGFERFLSEQLHHVVVIVVSVTPLGRFFWYLLLWSVFCKDALACGFIMVFFLIIVGVLVDDPHLCLVHVRLVVIFVQGRSFEARMQEVCNHPLWWFATVIGDSTFYFRLELSAKDFRGFASAFVEALCFCEVAELNQRWNHELDCWVIVSFE